MSKSGKAFRKNTSQTRMKWTFAQIRRISRHNLQPHNFVKLGTTKPKNSKPLCGLLADLADSTWPIHLWRVRKAVQAALAGGLGAAHNKYIFQVLAEAKNEKSQSVYHFALLAAIENG